MLIMFVPPRPRKPKKKKPQSGEACGSTRPQPLSLPPLLLTHSLSLSDYWALEVRATEMKAQFIVGAFLPSCPTLLLVLHFVLYYTHFIIYRVSQQVLDKKLQSARN